MFVEHKQSYQQRLLSLGPYQDTIYQEIDLAGLAAYAVQWLQQRTIPTTFENIVLLLFKFFPTKFSLSGYPNFPDSARVGRTLLQLGPKYRNWARGSVQKGFLLTQAGFTKADSVGQILESGLHRPRAATKKRQMLGRTLDLSKELAQLEGSPLYIKWKAEKLEEGSTMDILTMLGAYAYTPLRAIRDRIKLLQETALQLGRRDILNFLKDITKTLEKRLGESS